MFARLWVSNHNSFHFVYPVRLDMSPFHLVPSPWYRLA